MNALVFRSATVAPALVVVAAIMTASAAAAQLAQANASATAAAVGALADFVPDQGYLARTMSLDYVDADADPCLVHENCLSGPGMRRVLRFGTKVHNTGTADAILGGPPRSISPDNPPYWHWDTCHQHWHFTAYAHYQLDELGDNSRPVADGVGHRRPALGTKSGFCLEDLECPAGLHKRYTCAYQGVSAGCADVYDESLKCQWIDITDLVTDPTYINRRYALSVTINRDGLFPELRTDNNVARVEFSFGDVPERSVLLGQGAPEGFVAPFGDE
ncbi:hypothetical protein HK405_008701 [Cladochytrium tenue]|nr:hypothetical protein HK405_008701 [Cladochytrium tenue]